jgi:hypothetical protein
VSWAPIQAAVRRLRRLLHGSSTVARWLKSLHSDSRSAGGSGLLRLIPGRIRAGGSQPRRPPSGRSGTVNSQRRGFFSGHRVLAFCLGAIFALGTALGLHIHSRTLPTWATDPQEPPAAHWVGAFHVHSEASHDCRTPVAELATAAAAEGLNFLVRTDHNAVRPAEQQRGVDLLSWPELSTPSGHVIALGLTEVPSRSIRHRPDILAWLHRASSLAVVAHPSDRKRPWLAAGQDAGGVEVCNVAATARRLGGRWLHGLLITVLAWPFNPPLALATLYDRDAAALQLLDDHPDPGFVALCGLDAHGFVPTAQALRSWQVVAPRGADQPAPASLSFWQRGHWYCSAGLLGRPQVFNFYAAYGRNTVARSGDTAQVSSVDALRVDLSTLNGRPPEIVLYRGSKIVMQQKQKSLVLDHPPAGTYRVEVRAMLPNLLAGARSVPVLYSNRIRLQAK